MKRVNKKDKDNILMPKNKKNVEESKVTLTKEQILSLVKKKNDSPVRISIPTLNMHPTAEQRKELKNVTKEEFNRYVRKCGSSGHIGVSKHWVNKFVKVTMEEILD